MVGILLFILVVTIGYLSGSVCSAVIVSRIFALPDPRTSGSNNPGATNVLRLAGKKYAIIVLVADLLKGLIPLLLAQFLGANSTALGFTCLAAVLGHIYPIFFNFQGGKGVATALGALLGLHFVLGVIVIAVWLLVANFSRYSSLASIISLAIAPIIAIKNPGIHTFPPLLLMAFFVIYQHRNNINRLIDGEEPKIILKNHSLSDITNTIVRDNSQAIDPDATPIPATKTKAAPKKVSPAAVKKTRKPATKASPETTAKSVKKSVSKKPKP